MPAMQVRVQRQLEERERRERVDAEMRQLAVDRRHNEDAWKKREAGKKAAGISSKPGRAVGGRRRAGWGRTSAIWDSGASGEADEVRSGEARSQRSVGDEEGTGACGL